MLTQYRNYILPPYSRKDLLAVLITLFILLMIPLAVLTVREQTNDRGRAQEAPASWVLLGTHPQASMQPSAVGKQLATLVPWNGKIYIGYGDAGANTGPIAIAPYNPATNSFENLFSMGTHQISTFRPIADKLYATAHQDCCTGANYAEGEPWQNRKPVNLVHSMDIATFTGTDRWIAGQTNYAALLYRSTDGGQTWSLATQYNPGGTYYRYSFIGIYNGKLYVQAAVAATAGNTHTPASKSQVFDGSQWSAGPTLLPSGGTGWHPVTFAGKMVYLTSPQFYVDKKYLMSFDGTSARQVMTNEVYDFSIENNELYILRTDGKIQKTTDLVNWTDVSTTSPLNYYSIAVLNGKVYVGTKDATIYVLDTSGSISPTTLPLATPTVTPIPTTPLSSPTSILPTATPAALDSINPTISITSPADGSTINRRGTVTIAANATDNIGVDHVTFTVAGNVSIDYTAPYSYAWSVSGKPNATYTITATAYDASGNNTLNAVRVTTSK